MDFSPFDSGQKLRLWLVTLQSSQLDVTGMAIGWPTELFARALETAIMSVAEARGLLNEVVTATAN